MKQLLINNCLGLANFTSESLEVNVYSRRRVCGDGGALSDDMDSDDDDDEFNFRACGRCVRRCLHVSICRSPCRQGLQGSVEVLCYP
eukprot:scaffold18824_cov49-Phaeocystis_antarctica.AAC.3